MEGLESLDKTAWTKEMLIWTKLVSETGVDWSSELGTISVSDEWCKAKIQEIREAKKFRHNGIELSLKIKFDKMYSNIITTGEFAWAPSSGVLGGNDVNPGTSKVNIDGADFEEGSSDSEYGISNLDTDMSRMDCRSSGKRKERDPFDVRGRKKKTSGIGVQLLSSDSTSLNIDRQGCSIPEVMDELYSIPGVSIDDDFHDFASEYLSLRRKREMWSSMGDLEQKLKWLQRMYARSKRA
ncbi:hypothetical protein BDE02_15G044200 [Populus trichocarpa]|nr:hypothetical protein BDE02_15G044200 [Populus trichocarpa]